MLITGNSLQLVVLGFVDAGNAAIQSHERLLTPWCVALVGKHRGNGGGGGSGRLHMVVLVCTKYEVLQSGLS